jgi:uncharacterized protein (DUF302 family)
MNMPAMKRQVRTPYDEVVARVRDALASEGFGVLTTIDIQKTLADKIGAAIPRYQILGACNPKLAHHALQMDRDVGVLLPCNVAIYEDGGEGDERLTTISVVDPVQAIAPFGDDRLQGFAQEVRARLQRVLEGVR